MTTRAAETILSRPPYTGRGGSLAQPMAYEEDLSRRFGKRASLPNWLIDVLGAVRPICRHPDVTQYKDDIKKLGDFGIEYDELETVLEHSGFDEAQRVAWFVVARGLDFIRTKDNIFMALSDTYCCERCDDDYSSDEDFWTVRVNQRCTQQWCALCKENNSFYCYFSETQYDETQYESGTVDDSCIICCEIASDYNYHFCGAHDCYCEGGPCDEGEGEEDEAPTRRRDSSIPAYHEAERNWNYRDADRSLRAFYGFELEIEFQSAIDRWTFFETHELDKRLDVCAERDGSLDDYKGLEIITRPIPMQELRQEGNFFKVIVDALKAVRAHGSSREYPYGLHITTNHGRLMDDHKRRLYQFVYAMRPLVVFISGRYSEDYASFRLTTRGGKHSAFHERHDDAAEMRTFKSTNDWNRIMGYVELLDAMTEWTRNPHAVVTAPLAAPLFRSWLRTKPEYSNLANRLFKPEHSFPKELPACALPSSNREVALSVKNGSKPASKIILTAQASPSTRAESMNFETHQGAMGPRAADHIRIPEALMPLLVAVPFEPIRDSSLSMPSMPPIYSTMSIPVRPYFTSESSPEATTQPLTVTPSVRGMERWYTTEQSLGLEPSVSENPTLSSSPR